MGLIYLDSCLVIYLVERHPVWLASLRQAIAAEPEAQFAISPLVKAECLIGPLRRGDLPAEAAYQVMFGTLATVDIPEAAYLAAARLRARFGLKLPDALHLACAQQHQCVALWTNDARLAATGGMAVALSPAG